jgi:ornithine decarboxylase
MLPPSVQEGDYIEIGQIGAYGRVLANHFNGYGQYDEVVLTDEPMLSMYDTAVDEAPAAALRTARA